MVLELREIVCMWCGEVFWLCSACDRGQRYCSEECRRARRAERLRAYRKKYARSESGRKNNRQRQRRFRLHQRPSSHPGPTRKKTVTDHSSHEPENAFCWLHDRAQTTTGGTTTTKRVPPSIGKHSKRARIRRCSSCGRMGIVVRGGTKRGRFRWG